MATKLQDSQTINDLDLASAGIIQAFEQYVEDASLNYDREALYRFIRHVEPALVRENFFAGRDPEVGVRYRSLLAKAKLICLFRLNISEILELLSAHLHDALTWEDVPYDLIEECKAKLARIFVDDEMVKFKETLKENIEGNKSIITKTSLMAEGREESGTSENWLKDYRRFVAERGLEEALARAEYFAGGAQMKWLSDSERAIVKKLVEFYEWLSIPADTPKGWEQPIVMKEKGKLAGFRAGQLEVYESDPVVRQVLRWMRERGLLGEMGKRVKEAHTTWKSPGESLKEQADIIRSLSQKFDTDLLLKKAESEFQSAASNPRTLIEEFHKQLFMPLTMRKENQEIIGLLLLIAKKGWFEEIFTHPSFRATLESAFQERMGKESVQEFRLVPRQQKFLLFALRMILEDRLALSSSEAAVVAIKVVHFMRASGNDKYRDVAYYDMNTREFQWNQ